MKCWARTHLLLPNLFFETLTLTYRECLSHPPLLIVSFFFSRSWQKRRPLLPSSNYNLQYIPFIVTTYSAHVVFKCNAFTNRIGVCYQVCYCTPCQIYLNYSTRLHSTYIKRWGFYRLIIRDQRAQTCFISINLLRKFWSGSVGADHPILS